MQLKPLGNRVIIKRLAEEVTSSGGIIIPDSAKEKPLRGEVLATGPGKDDVKMTVKQGNTVLFAKYAGSEISIDGDDLIIMSEDDILAILS
ncbi:MAG: co-chaperone GroES [Proteobacteria bacterium]|nr:co-chaperone GroES [Pseudomonadota bacterium]MBU1612318.1 co-chaperone GroES [Pseudomonadota bacterium]